MKTCPNNHSNPVEAQFCRICGHKFGVEPNLPFHMLHPEYHLRPFSEFRKIRFWFNKPDYMEDPQRSEVPEYFFIAKNGKLGILFWRFKKHWYGGSTNKYHRVIPCEYDRIEKKVDMFICYKGEERVFIDLKGNILK